MSRRSARRITRNGMGRHRFRRGGISGCTWWAISRITTHGSVVALDPATGEVVMKVTEPTRGNGLLSTGGGLVVSTDRRGYIIAYDADTLETLWTRDIGTGFAAPAMTYSYDGTQYVAVLAGQSGRGYGDPRLDNRSDQSLLLVFGM